MRDCYIIEDKVMTMVRVGRLYVVNWQRPQFLTSRGVLECLVEILPTLMMTLANNLDHMPFMILINEDHSK